MKRMVVINYWNGNKKNNIVLLENVCDRSCDGQYHHPIEKLIYTI